MSIDDVSGIAAEAVVLPLQAPADGQSSVTGTISAASSDTVSPSSSNGTLSEKPADNLADD